MAPYLSTKHINGKIAAVKDVKNISIDVIRLRYHQFDRSQMFSTYH